MFIKATSDSQEERWIHLKWKPGKYWLFTAMIKEIKCVDEACYFYKQRLLEQTFTELLRKKITNLINQ
jgi:hypothetical protein